VIETVTFVCSICSETSTDICVFCTKDTCANHRCMRCLRCSDCCECEVPLTAGEVESAHAAMPPAAETVPEPHVPVVAELIAAQAETVIAAESETAFEVVVQPEMPGVAAIVLPEPAPVPSAVEQATTAEELVRALPELFAAEHEPPKQQRAEEPAKEPETEEPRTETDSQ
jgi:hypothetical protein